MEPKHPRPTSRTTRPRRRLLLRVSVAGLVLVALTVSVVSLALAVTPSFPDVTASHPYHEAVTDLAGRGIINGYADGSFRPGDPVMRQQFAKMIVLTMGHDVPPGIVCPFLDVDLTPNPVDPLYPAKYVAVCALHGITRGTTATTFDPYADITRFQLLSMVVRAVDEVRPGLLLAPPDTFLPTWDPDLSPQHGDNAARAEYNGLLAGMGLSVLDPDGDMTRGETAQVLHNVLAEVTPVTTTLTSTTEPPTTEPPTTSTSSSTTTTAAPPPSYENLGGFLSSGPGVASRGPGLLDVFVRGPGDALWQKWYEGGWSQWNSLGDGGVSLASDPAAASWDANRIDVYYRGNDNNVWSRIWTSVGGWTPHAWDPGANKKWTSGPAVVAPRSSRLDIFVRGEDGALWNDSYINGSIKSWTGWQSRGGMLTSDPAAVSWGPDRIDVFARGPFDHLFHKSLSGATWSMWEDLGGALASGPGVASWGPERLDVFVRGPGDTLWHKWFDGVWSTWEDLGIPFQGDPDAVSWGPNRIDVFMRGTDNALWHRWWNGSKWMP